jgi:hypothetical protein
MQAIFLSANELHRVARDAVKAAHTESLQSLVAVMFSCAYVEAALNELLHQIAEAETENVKRLGPLARAAGLYEKTAAVSRKLGVLGAAASGKEVDFGSQPFQDFDLLLELRNWLVHLRPEPLTLRENPSEEGTSLINDQYHKLIERLAQWKVIEIPRSHLLSVTSAAQLPGVAPWSLRTAEAVLQEVHRWIPDWRPPIVGTVESIE